MRALDVSQLHVTVRISEDPKIPGCAVRTRNHIYVNLLNAALTFSAALCQALVDVLTAVRPTLDLQPIIMQHVAGTNPLISLDSIHCVSNIWRSMLWRCIARVGLFLLY